MGRYNRTLEERFWEKVDKSPGQGSGGECWGWQGAKTKQGYGMFKTSKNEMAHRVSFRWSQGQIPDGQKVCHHCDYPPCVRPDHLFSGTQRDNVIDAVKKGRLRNYKRGSEHHNARKTTCKHGHPFDVMLPSGWRRCSTCEGLRAAQRKEREANWSVERKAAAKSAHALAAREYDARRTPRVISECQKKRRAALRKLRAGERGPRKYHNAEKTACPNGHAYVPGSMHVNQKGWRRCLICKREQDVRYQRNRRTNMTNRGQGRDNAEG